MAAANDSDTKLTLVRKDPAGHWVLYKNKRGEPVVKAIRVRASFPHFLEPYVGEDAKEGDKGSFGMTAMVDKASQKSIMLICKEIMDGFLKENNIPALGADKKFIRNGDENAGRPEYAGHYTISARNPKRPKLRNKNNENVDRDDIEEVFYSGCYVDVLFSPWYQDGKTVGKGFGIRINSRLVAVKFNDDGEALAGDSISDDDVDSAFGDDDEGGFATADADDDEI